MIHDTWVMCQLLDGSCGFCHKMLPMHCQICTYTSRLYLLTFQLSQRNSELSSLKTFCRVYSSCQIYLHYSSPTGPIIRELSTPSRRVGLIIPDYLLITLPPNISQAGVECYFYSPHDPFSSTLLLHSLYMHNKTWLKRVVKRPFSGINNDIIFQLLGTSPPDRHRGSAPAPCSGTSVVLSPRPLTQLDTPPTIKSRKTHCRSGFIDI